MRWVLCFDFLNSSIPQKMEISVLNTIWFWFANTISVWCIPLWGESSHIPHYAHRRGKNNYLCFKDIKQSRKQLCKLEWEHGPLFRVCKFHFYLYGWSFTFLTDLLLLSYLWTTLSFSISNYQEDVEMSSSIVCLHLLSNTEISSLVDYADVLSRLALSFNHQKLMYFGELENIQKFYQELKLIGGPNNILNSGQIFYREKPEMRLFSIHKWKYTNCASKLIQMDCH